MGISSWPPSYLPINVVVSDLDKDDDPTQPGVGRAPTTRYPLMREHYSQAKPGKCYVCAGPTVYRLEKSETDSIPCCPMCADQVLDYQVVGALPGELALAPRVTITVSTTAEQSRQAKYINETIEKTLRAFNDAFDRRLAR